MVSLEKAVRRNTLILAGSMALTWSVIQLVSALGAVMLRQLADAPALVGVAPGLYLLGHGAGSLVIGRAMDAWGRRNGLLLAALSGAGGALLLWLAVSRASLAILLVGLVITGLGTGGGNLARAAGADMYPPERRARGITLVMVGAAFGAIGSPLLFAPLLSGARSHDPGALAAPWPLAAALMLASAAVLLAIRVDPREVAERLRARAAPLTAPVARPAGARSLGELLAVPTVPLGLLAAIVAQAVMTATMALVGLVLVDHGHDLGAVSVTMSAHFLGMFALVLVVGRLVDRIGRFLSVLAGLVVIAGGLLLLLPGVALSNVMPAMFAVGVGWNIAFVASTALLADAAGPLERGRLLGFSDWIAITVAALVSVGAGLVVGTLGLTALVLIGLLMALVPAGIIAANRTRLEGSPSAPRTVSPTAQAAAEPPTASGRS